MIALEPHVLLQPDGVADRIVLERPELPGGELAGRSVLARLQERGRPQQAADVVGAERGCRSHRQGQLTAFTRECTPSASATRSEARSPIITTGAWVLPDVDLGHHRRVGDAQAFDPVHPQLRVDDCQLVDAHPAGADLVVVGDRVAADVCAQLVAADAVAGVELLPHPPGQGGLPADLAAQLDGGRERLDVLVGREARGVEQRCRLDIGRGEAQRPTADRPDQASHQREAVRRAVLVFGVERQVEEERLEVGPLEPAARPREEVPVQGLQAGERRRHDVVGREDDGREHVVVQVLADAGQVDERLDAEASERGRGTDPREHQQLGRLDRPGTNDDLVPGPCPAQGAILCVFHADAARALEEEPDRPGGRQHGQVRRTEHGAQERLRNAVTAAVADVQLGVADPVGIGAVLVVVERDARLLRRRHRRSRDRMRLVAGDHGEEPAGAVVRVGPAVEVLGALEDRQDVVVAPPVVAEGGPAVVVGPVAAHVDHPVQGARPAEHLPSRPVQLPPRAGSLRHGAVPPVLLGVPQLEQARGIVDGRVLVEEPCLEQEHTRAGVDQPAGDDGSRRAGADDDDVCCDVGLARCHRRLLLVAVSPSRRTGRHTRRSPRDWRGAPTEDRER